jgi:hypothetical protein
MMSWEFIVIAAMVPCGKDVARINAAGSVNMHGPQICIPNQIGRRQATRPPSQLGVCCVSVSTLCYKFGRHIDERV